MGENIIGPSSKGPYDSSTQAGKGSNAGFNVLQSINDGSIFQKSIQYKDGNDDDYTFGYSEVTLASMDSDRDTKVTAKDKKWQDLADVYNNISDKSMLDQSLLTDGNVDPQKVFNKFDVNHDGEYDAGEDAAYSKLQDEMAENPTFSEIGKGKANDGVLTQDEIDQGCNYMFANTTSDEKNGVTKSRLATIYDDNNFKEKYDRFKKTGTSVEQTADTSEEKVTASGDTIVGSQHGHNILRTDPSKDIFNQPSRIIHGHTIRKTTTPETNPVYQTNRKVIDNDD